MNKKIILAITRDVQLYDCFIDNLNQLGFEVLLLCDNKTFKYKKLSHKIINFFRKKFLKDRDYKKKLHLLYKTSEYHQLLNNITNNYDYGLIIRPDLFDENIIKLIQKKTTNLYGYQWDGLSRFPNVYKTIPLFKKFYVFDEDDLDKNENTYVLNNFYFDCYSKITNPIQPQYDVYYIGSYDSRIELIMNICEQLHGLGLKLNIHISGPKSDTEKLKKYSYVNIISKEVSYKDNLKNVANAKIILDVVQTSHHKGLSFRPFEALGYDKKLITTNTSIKEYDFYDPNNIHVYNENSNFMDFIKNEYTPVNQEIKDKYNFTNWINHVLELDTTK